MLTRNIANRYQIVAELGRGGMGVVYKAHDTLLERDVAIKMLSTTGLGTEGRGRLMNEARAAASLNHPNIVAVYDAGQTEIDGRPLPYIVMELLDGPTLHDQRPESLEQTITITRQLCSALEHAHEHEIIHRDLKPENVMIAPNGSVKLMDFGLARSITTRVTAEGTIKGTLFYMAPEMVMGKSPDHRADLYSLGVMLYELTTGRLPFESDEPVAVISQHLHAPLVPPVAHNPDLRPGINQLIVSLMEKEPDKRPQSAGDVLALLDQIDRAPESQPQAHPSLQRIVRGRLIGREREFNQARGIWTEAATGQGHALLISGEPGIGKTRLVNELETLVRASGGKVFSGASYAEGGMPYAPFRQILRQSLSDNHLQLPEQVLAPLFTLVPELSLQHEGSIQNLSGDPLQEQQTLFESTALYFRLLSERAPLMLILEDAHWADSGTIAMMRQLARGSQRQPLLLALTYREVEIDEATAFHKALLDLRREGLATRIKLTRLDRAATEALLETLFDEEITPEFLESIYRETEGNPFFIEEISKALVESGQLVFRDGRWHRPPIEELGVPQSIRVAIQSRASALEETSRKVIEQAAVLGRTFELRALELATDFDEETLIDALEEALAAQLITEEKNERFSFMHALIPASLTAGLRTLSARRLQRRAAQALETLHPQDYGVLAHHFIKAGQIDKGADYLLKAGDQARTLYAHEEAIQSYKGAVEYLKDEGQMAKAGQALMKLGLVYNNAFQFAQSRLAYREGFALLSQYDPGSEPKQPSAHPLRLIIGDPHTLDPANSADVTSDVYLSHLFSGLLYISDEMDVLPDVAQSWEVLHGGLKYRFQLREDAYWSDGVAVTADDFEFAWQRLLSPENQSPLASQLFAIQNAQEYFKGRVKEWHQVGVEVVDAQTLEITLKHPDSTLLYRLGHMNSYPVPKHKLGQLTSPWPNWREMVTNGPFLIADYKPGQKMVLRANPLYHGQRSGNLQTIEFEIWPSDVEWQGNLAQYEENRVDMATIAATNAILARNRYADEHRIIPTLQTYYLGLNTWREPLDDRRVRRALALAIDKEQINRIYLAGNTIPASGGFLPPGMPGFIEGLAPPFNPSQAQRLLDEAGIEDGSAFPRLKLISGTNLSQNKALDAIIKGWQDHLNIDVEHIVLPFQEVLQRVDNEPPDIFHMGWRADIPDPDDFLRLGIRLNWQHAEYARLVDQARQLMDQKARMDYYRRAQEILVEEMPIIPIGYVESLILVKPWVTRFPTSPLKFWYFKDVIIEGHPHHL